MELLPHLCCFCGLEGHGYQVAGGPVDGGQDVPVSFFCLGQRPDKVSMDSPEASLLGGKLSWFDVLVPVDIYSLAYITRQRYLSLAILIVCC